MTSPTGVEGVDEQRVEWIGALYLFAIGVPGGFGGHFINMRRIHALIGLGDLRRIIGLTVRSDGLEQPGADDFVDLLVRDWLDVCSEALEAFLQRHECLLTLLALRHLVPAAREGRDHDRAGHLLRRFG